MSDTLDTHPSARVVKLLNIGESGSAKTGAMASLVIAGYNLWVLDYDNGLDILANLLRDNPEALRRVHYRTLRDTITISGGVPKVKPPVSAWKQAGKTLTEWNIAAMTPNDIVVLDTLTTASQAAFNESLSVNGRLNARSHESDYGWMADSVLLFIDALTSDEINCNVIVNTHVKFLSGDEETQTVARGLPNAKGQQISKDIGKFFNTIVYSRSIGSGPATRRVITTQPHGVVSVKTSAPATAKPSYPVETGLADLFKDILGHGPILNTATEKA